MLKALFSSQVRIALLHLFLLNPDATFHAQSLSAQIGAHYSAVWKELANLERAGILTSEKTALQRLYRLNPQCPIVPELRAIFFKTRALGDVLCPVLAQAGNVQAAFVYGSAANEDFDASSDIDLMVIGDVSLVEFAARIAKLEKELGRSINYVLYSHTDWNAKRRKHEPFIENVVKSPKIFLTGSEDALRKTDSAKTNQALSGKTRRTTPPTQTRRPRPQHRRT